MVFGDAGVGVGEGVQLVVEGVIPPSLLTVVVILIPVRAQAADPPSIINPAAPGYFFNGNLHNSCYSRSRRSLLRAYIWQVCVPLVRERCDVRGFAARFQVPVYEWVSGRAMRGGCLDICTFFLLFRKIGSCRDLGTSRRGVVCLCTSVRTRNVRVTPHASDSYLVF